MVAVTRLVETEPPVWEFCDGYVLADDQDDVVPVRAGVTGAGHFPIATTRPPGRSLRTVGCETDR